MTATGSETCELNPALVVDLGSRGELPPEGGANQWSAAMAARQDRDFEDIRREGRLDAEVLELSFEDHLEPDDTGSEDSGVSSFLDRFLRPAPPSAG